MFQDVVQKPEYQHEKKYQEKPSSLPESSTIKVHTTEVFWKFEGYQVVKSDRVGGDVWFYSIASRVEIMKNLCVQSTFIEQNTNFPEESFAQKYSSVVCFSPRRSLCDNI